MSRVLEGEQLDFSLSLPCVSSRYHNIICESQLWTHVVGGLLTPEVIQILGLLSDLSRQSTSMIPPLFIIILGVPQFRLNLLVPLLLLEEPESSLVFLRSPLGKPQLGLSFGSSSFLLKLDDPLEFLDG